MDSWFSFLGARLPELWLRTGEHILLTGASTLVAIVIGVPLGVCASRVSRLKGVIMGVVGILQTVPSLAMLAFLLALLGRIGAVPALIALALYALLPIVRNTVAGLGQVPAPILEAANGVGMTRSQSLWWVELPLAMPVIVTGIRTAAVIGVGIATLSAFIGAGGLGQFINRGLSLSNNHLILLGAIPSALLALIVDGAIGSMQWALQRRSGRGEPSWLRHCLKAVALSAPALLLLVGCLGVFRAGAPGFAGWDVRETEGRGVILVGSKNFTEQLILGELMAQLIERETDLQVIRKFGLGGTMICHGALMTGGIDLYAEYTGTALTAVLGRKVIADPEKTYALVAKYYEQNLDLQWLEPLGFNNTYVLTVRSEDAEQYGLRRISDLQSRASDLRAGWTFEFSERPDGYPGLQECYGFSFGMVRDIEASLMYEAIARGEVDVISAFATDGRIVANRLTALEDDRRFFPPYFAAPILRRSTLDRHPELEAVLDLLAGRLSAATMQRLNLLVDLEGQSPARVAREFLVNEIGITAD